MTEGLEVFGVGGGGGGLQPEWQKLTLASIHTWLLLKPNFVLRELGRRSNWLR
jgi:hypothetical protein